MGFLLNLQLGWNSEPGRRQTVKWAWDGGVDCSLSISPIAGVCDVSENRWWRQAVLDTLCLAVVLRVGLPRRSRLHAIGMSPPRSCFQARRPVCAHSM